MDSIAQKIPGGPRGGGVTACVSLWKSSSRTGASLCAQGTTKLHGSASPSGTTRSVACRQNWQWAGGTADPGVGTESPAEAAASAVTQRGPSLVQISTPSGACPLASISACDTVGASAPSTATSTASHTTQGRYGCVRRGEVFIRRRADAYILCLLWSMAGMPPAGAAVFTGTVTSVLVSTPLASLNTRVSATVLSLASGAFRSINMTW